MQLLRGNGPARDAQPACARPWKTTQEVYQLAVDHMSQGFCVFDADMRVVIANARFAELYGLAPEQVKPGVSLQDIVALRIAAGIYAGATPEEYQQSRLAPQIGAVWDDVLSNGRIIHIVTAPIAGVGWISTHEDITEHRQHEAHLRHVAQHDMLTGLPNRQALRETARARARTRAAWPWLGSPVHQRRSVQASEQCLRRGDRRWVAQGAGEPPAAKHQAGRYGLPYRRRRIRHCSRWRQCASCCRRLRSHHPRAAGPALSCRRARTSARVSASASPWCRLTRWMRRNSSRTPT